MKYNILIVDDEEDIRLSIAGILEDANYEVSLAKNSDEALDAISKKIPDLVILDIWLEDSKLDGLDLLNEIYAKFTNLPCVMISGHGNIDIAVKAIRSGASDFIEKPFESERLLITLERALELSKLKKQHKELWVRAGGDIELIGKSSSIKNIKNLVTKIAPTGCRAFIIGEYGTGKETLARLIHHKSRRSSCPFVVLNAKTLSSELLEEELFGKEDDLGRIVKIGIFEEANNGTLYIDEVSELTLDAQSYFVKALQDNTFIRKNGSSKINVDVRVLSSSSVQINEKILNKEFSEDLYYRLNVITIEMPSLYERKEDIPVLVDYFFFFLSE